MGYSFDYKHKSSKFVSYYTDAMKKLSIIILTLLAAFSCSHKPTDGTHTLRILTTNDIHGTYFDSLYVGNDTRRSMMAINWYVDSVRNAAGRGNVLLLDAGDCMQGDNAAYYFNYVDTLTPHIWPRLVKYMGYDAVAVGNHDIETGHGVYDRVTQDMRKAGIPFMAGNALRTDNGKPYFPAWKVVERAGLRVLILGYTNANMKAWLSEPIWRGMDFVSLLPLVQEDVDRLKAKTDADVVIAIVHSGVGKGDGSILESQAMDLFKSLSGVDVVICGHDHRPYTAQNDSIILLNSGSHSRNVGYGEIRVEVKDGQIQSKTLSAGLIPVDKDKADPVMRAAFQQDYEAVKAFTVKPIGELKGELVNCDAVLGMCPYINLIHKVCLDCTPAQISFAAPLSVKGGVQAGTLLYNDMFKIYPFENQLFVVKLTGEQIKNYLECSYDNWVWAPGEGDGHILKIASRGDARYGYERWSFLNATYNFDSAAGINYSVDVTKPVGERVSISSMADGSAFEPSQSYNVAMTSYRASGGGGLMIQGAGVDTSHIEDITVEKYPEIRQLIYQYISANGGLDASALASLPELGSWSFVPESAAPAMERDFHLVFGD